MGELQEDELAHLRVAELGVALHPVFRPGRLVGLRRLAVHALEQGLGLEAHLLEDVEPEALRLAEVDDLLERMARLARHEQGHGEHRPQRPHAGEERLQLLAADAGVRHDGVEEALLVVLGLVAVEEEGVRRDLLLSERHHHGPDGEAEEAEREEPRADAADHGKDSFGRGGLGAPPHECPLQGACQPLSPPAPPRTETRAATGLPSHRGGPSSCTARTARRRPGAHTAAAALPSPSPTSA